MSLTAPSACPSTGKRILLCIHAYIWFCFYHSDMADGTYEESRLFYMHTIHSWTQENTANSTRNLLLQVYQLLFKQRYLIKRCTINMCISRGTINKLAKCLNDQKCPSMNIQIFFDHSSVENNVCFKFRGAPKISTKLQISVESDSIFLTLTDWQK